MHLIVASKATPGGVVSSKPVTTPLKYACVRRCIYLFVALGGVISTKRSITPPKELACLSRPRGRQVSDVGWDTFLILFPTSKLTDTLLNDPVTQVLWEKAITVLTGHRVRLGLTQIHPCLQGGASFTILVKADV